MSPPILTADRFPEVFDHLRALLRGLAPDDWHRPTLCSAWDVKDLVAHLVDTNLRRLSAQRDGYASPHLRPGADLLAFLTALNADWTRAARRLSPAVLTDLLDRSGRELAEFVGSLDPFGPAAFPVAWAGEAASAAWFDVAREYTEKWHHGQQLFEAADRPSPLLSRRLYRPALDTFLRALPFALRDARRPAGTALRITVDGDAGGDWWWVYADGWAPTEGPADPPAAAVALPAAVAWKVWTKRRPAAVKRHDGPGIRVAGDADLGRRVIEMVAVMA